MPDDTTTKGPIPGLDVAEAAIGQILQFWPIASAAYETLRRIWSATNPGKTTADYNAYLMEQATGMRTDAQADLLRYGWTKDPTTGAWVPPAPPG